MAYAHPAIILGVALLVWLLGRAPPPVLDWRAWVRRLVASVSIRPRGPWATAAAGLGLAALGALCGAATVWIAVDQVAFSLRAILPYKAAIAIEIAISSVLLALCFDPPPASLLGYRAHGIPPIRLALRWTRGLVTPLLLFAFAGLYAPVIYRGALEAARALRRDRLHPTLRRWAQWPAALVHYLPARIGALALALVAGARGDRWRSGADPWHREWAAAAMRNGRTEARRLLAWATLIVLALAGLVIWWPRAPS